MADPRRRLDANAPGSWFVDDSCIDCDACRPGHTRGSVSYLLEEKFLFTGDSLYWSRKRQALTASKNYCWYSWEKQIESLARLADYPFEWVLAGHGDRFRLPRDRARESLLAMTRQFSRA